MIWIPVALAGLALLWLLLRRGRGGGQDGGYGPYGGSSDSNLTDSGSFVTPFPITSPDNGGYSPGTAPDSTACEPGSGGWDSGGGNDSSSCDSGGGDSGGGGGGGD